MARENFVPSVFLLRLLFWLGDQKSMNAWVYSDAYLVTTAEVLICIKIGKILINTKPLMFDILLYG